MKARLQLREEDDQFKRLRDADCDFIFETGWQSSEYSDSGSEADDEDESGGAAEKQRKSAADVFYVQQVSYRSKTVSFHIFTAQLFMFTSGVTDARYHWSASDCG